MEKIFYIEQEKFLREMVEEALDHEGVKVYSVSSLDDCFFIIEDLGVDLILVDFHTAKNRLSSFLSGLNSKKSISHIPVVGVGFSEDDKKSDFCEKAIIGYIDKPVSPTGLYGKLLDSVSKCLPNQREE